MLNTHNRTTLRCNHRILHHDFETALDHDDDDNVDDDDDDDMMMMMMMEMMMMRVNQLTVCQNT